MNHNLHNLTKKKKIKKRKHKIGKGNMSQSIDYRLLLGTP